MSSMVDYPLIWSSIKKELETRMSRNDYVLHLDRAQFLEFDDSRHFIVAASNEYDREWMDSRLSATINNMLKGYLEGNGSQVKFVAVMQKDNGLDKSNVLSCQADTVTIQSEELNFPDTRDLEDLNRIIILPGYYFRHVQRLGSTLWWIIAAFLQAGYRAGLSRSQTGLYAEGEFRTSEKEISQFSGIHGDTFWSCLDDSRSDRLKPFVRVVSRSEWVKVTSSNRSVPPKKLPNKLAVNMAMPLTPADTRSLKTWISTRVEELGSEGAVELAINTPLENLIPWNANLADNADSGEMLTASQIARQFGVSDEFSARLYQHIIPPQDVIIITHYFAKNCLRKLGHGPATMVTWLRDRCYVGTDEVRDTVTVSRQDIADWMGLKGARGEKTVRDWFGEKIITDFVIDMDKDAIRGASKKRQLRLNLEEPVQGWGIGRDSEYGENIIGRVSEYGETSIGRVSEYGKPPIGRDSVYENPPIGRESEYGKPPIGRDSEYALDAIPSMVEPKLDAIPCVKALLIKHLIKALPDPDDPTTSCKNGFFDNSENEKTGGGGSFSWNLKTLFEINQVDTRIATRILREGGDEDGWKMISWLLYGAAHPEVKTPVNLAVSRLIKNPAAGSGGVFDRLAHGPPHKLAEMVLRASCLDSPPSSEWRDAMELCTPVRLRNLVDHLGLTSLLVEDHETQ